MRKRLVSFVSVVVVAIVGTLLAAPTPAAAGNPAEGGPYWITDPAGEEYGFVIVPFFGDRFSIVPEGPDERNAESFEWYIEDADSGGVRIFNVAFERYFGPRCLVAPTISPGEEPFVRNSWCADSADRIWTFEAAPGGVRIVSQTSGGCITRPPEEAPNFAALLQPCGGPDQVFVFTSVP